MVADHPPSPVVRIPERTRALDPDDPLEVSAWRLTLGLVLLVPLPDVATDALVRGIDAPSLRQLAGIRDDDVWERDRLWTDTLEELGVDVPDPHTSRWLLILAAARDIVTRRIDPFWGAEDIDDLIDHDAPDMADLIIFTGLRWSWVEAGQFRERPGIEQEIWDAAADVVNRASAGLPTEESCIPGDHDSMRVDNSDGHGNA